MERHAPRPHVVIVGGYLTLPAFYGPMRRRLLERGAARVTIAPIHLPDWLNVTFVGFGPVLLRGARAIREARRRAEDPVIVIGHSAGGLVARLAMAPEPFWGRRAAVAVDVGCLVTLGTPHRLHDTIPGWHHPGLQAIDFLDRVSPGASHAPTVSYVSVGSSLVPPTRPAPVRAWAPARLVGSIMRQVVGETPGVPGDGIVSEDLSRLDGARHLVMPDALHGTFGGPWYGDARVIDRWWPVALDAWQEALDARRSAGRGLDERVVEGAIA